MSKKTELDWVADCHDNPMYAAEHIVKLEERIAELEEELKFHCEELRHVDAEHRTLRDAVIEAHKWAELGSIVRIPYDVWKACVLLAKKEGNDE